MEEFNAHNVTCIVGELEDILEKGHDLRAMNMVERPDRQAIRRLALGMLGEIENTQHRLRAIIKVLQPTE